MRIRGARRSGLVWTAVATTACGAGPSSSLPGDRRIGELSCSISTSEIFAGTPLKDAIPALTDPATTTWGEPDAAYLRNDDRVIGVLTPDGPLAIPLGIMWWHEIVNLNVGSTSLAITHCPLTGSTLAFDRSEIEGAEFGVSGLLYRNNLMMYDRADPESLWPQLARGARCGVRDGQSLRMVPAFEMTWDGWLSLNPGSRVLSGDTGHDRDYREYPYGDYDRPDNPQLLNPIPSLDGRRPPKERVLGVPDGEGGGVAYPFGALDGLGPRALVHGNDHVVLWDRARQSAAAFQPRLQDGTPVELVQDADGTIRDVGTGSAWNSVGFATSGPLAARRLEPVAEAYTVFWFAWASFQPEAELWEGR